MMALADEPADIPASPRHIAIIMDGNGRWATRRGLPRMEGHRRGIKTVRRIVETAGEIGLPYLTLFGFSAENWSRPSDEISALMGLLRMYLTAERRRLFEAGVQLRVIGEIDRLPGDLGELIADAIDLMAGNDRLVLTIALSYGGRQDIVAAAQQLAAQVALGNLAAADIDDRIFSHALGTRDLPDPDLIIRTGGEHRISNFLLWQSAYAEYVFSDTLWPDFTPDCLRAAILEYRKRDRRFGTLASA